MHTERRQQEARAQGDVMKKRGALLEGGAGAEGDDMGAPVSDGHSERHRLKDCSIHQPLSPAASPKQRLS